MRIARRFSAWKNRVCLSPNRTVECFVHPEADHQKHDFKSELVTLLIKHEVEFDERYIWA